MNLLENIREGLRSISANMLRTVLTAMIIAIGITSLVGILTAIDGIQGSVDNSFADLGANTFDIRNPQMWRRRSGGKMDHRYPVIAFREAVMFKEKFGRDATISLSSQITGIAQIKYLSLKTNPNIPIIGADENFLGMKGFKLTKGRNFSPSDLENSANVTIIGDEIAKKIFPKQNPIGQEVTALGRRFQVIGVLEKKGSLTGGSEDRMFIVPIENGRAMGANRTLSFDLTTSVPSKEDAEVIMAEAQGIMRRIRGDLNGQPDSFEIERADSVAKDFEQITGFLRIGGFCIGFITLLGAAIALMNIMMVSVTERTREIGIRKSLGATPMRIREQFLIEAIVICILGGIGGLILGIGVGNLIAGLVFDNSSFIVPWVWMIMGIVVCVVVGLISGVYPAIKASKLDPIESLRYE